MEHYGQVDASSTIYIFFSTYGQDGASIAPSSALEAADVKLYKNGSATQRSSTSGWTMTSPFDSITGLHLLAIDLSDNTDAGFYAAGSRYTAVLNPDETIDGLSVSGVLADFTIGPPSANVTQWLGTAAATPTVAGVPEVDLTHIAGSAVSTSSAQLGVNAVQAGGTAWASGAIVAGAFAANAIADASVSTDMDIYQAKVEIIDDNSGSADRYVVIWCRNGQPLLSGITSPTIQVWKASDGTDLIASTSMTEIASTQTFRYTAASGERLVDGAAYVLKVTATIAGATQTWVQGIGRDS